MTKEQKEDQVSRAEDLLCEARKLLSEVYTDHEVYTQHDTSQLRLACVKLSEVQEHARRARFEIEGR